MAGVISGVAFAFSPYVLFEMGRIQLVATQWIPACFLFLHRAVEEQRLRDVAGLWICYLLQIGTCLYYAMFLVPLLGLATLVLLMRRRPPPRFYAWFAGGGALAGAIALGMVFPYFQVRDDFDLERSLSFASSYDGKLEFFGNVHVTNHTLTGLHHVAQQRGAHEEIAFPGFTVLTLALLSLIVPLGRAVKTFGSKRTTVIASGWLLVTLLTAVSTLIFYSMLAGALVLSLGLAVMHRLGSPTPFRGQRGLYLALLLLAVALFLGLSPLEWNDSPVRGIYYYFHTYFPGFNGIRKVSRQAVMTTFLACVLAGMGGAWLLARLPRRGPRVFAMLVLLGASLFELRSFPHPIAPVWAGEAVPDVYRFARSLPREDLIANYPQNAGVRVFRGDLGMALHNYLALYHRHRFVNGQSSWMPPVTELVKQSLKRLPNQAARRALLSVGTRHLIVFGDDLPASRRNLPKQLLAQPQHYRRVFEQEAHHVFTLLDQADPNLALLDTPQLPQGAQLVPATELEPLARPHTKSAFRAIDGKDDSYWSSLRPQQKGQYFELKLSHPRRLVALEIHNPPRPMDVPAAFELSVSHEGSRLKPVVTRPRLRLYRKQIFSPKKFIYRVVLPQPIWADRLRLTIEQGVPGHYFSIHEARLYAHGKAKKPSQESKAP